MQSSFSLVPTVPDTSQVGPLRNHIGGFAEALVKQGYASYDRPEGWSIG